MIDLYTWPTPNGHKIHIMLEETGQPYKVHAIDISAGDQFDPEFLKISPNNKMPAMVDPDGPGGAPIGLFESGAMLIYLAEKTGQFLSKDARQRYATLQWLMWQMGGIGPMLGQAHHFIRYAPVEQAYARERFMTEDIDAFAGLRTGLMKDVDKNPGLRILPGKFAAVQQAVGTLRGNGAAIACLRELVEDAKASGLIASLIEKHDARGLSVAPPA